MDARLREYREVDVLFKSRSFSEVRSSDDTVKIISLRKSEIQDKEKTITCMRINEINELENLNLDKKSKELLKKSKICKS